MDYQFARLGHDKKDLLEVGALLKDVFPDASDISSQEYLEWLYVKNPLGKAVGYNAYLNGELAAHYVTVPIQSKIHGKSRLGLLSLNTATGKAHQGKGLFTRLANMTYDAATAEGFQFVIGVANANSTPGFIRKLGFQCVAPLSVELGIGNIQYKHTDQSDLEFELELSKEFTDWRLNKPMSDYFFQGGIPYVGAKKGLVKVALAAQPLHQTQGVKQKKFSSLVSLWMGLAPSPDLTKKGLFVPLPDFAKPSPLNFIFKPLGTLGEIQLDPSQVYFDAIGFDAF